MVVRGLDERSEAPFPYLQIRFVSAKDDYFVVMCKRTALLHTLAWCFRLSRVHDICVHGTLIFGSDDEGVPTDRPFAGMFPQKSFIF